MGNLWRQNTQRCLAARVSPAAAAVGLVCRPGEGVSEGVKVERYLPCLSRCLLAQKRNGGGGRINAL